MVREALARFSERLGVGGLSEEGLASKESEKLVRLCDAPELVPSEKDLAWRRDDLRLPGMLGRAAMGTEVEKKKGSARKKGIDRLKCEKERQQLTERSAAVKITQGLLRRSKIPWEANFRGCAKGSLTYRYVI